MKRNTLLLIVISLFFLACEEERLPGDGGNVAVEGDAVPVKFNVELELGTGTEYVPMTRAEQPKNLTRVTSGNQVYLLLKLVNDDWYIDKKGTWKIDGINWNNTFITAETSWSPIEMELRPGTYRLVVFLNGRALSGYDNFSEGYRVADKETNVNDFPCLLTYNKRDLYYPGTWELGNEVFTGYVEFTVNKNDDVHTDAPERNFDVNLTRKVGQLQFLLKSTPGRDGNVFDTPYTLGATLRATPENPFCEGLNVLGLPYYNKEKPCTEIKYYVSTKTIDKGWRTDKEKRQYQMMESGSTLTAYFWLADPEKAEGTSFEMDDVKVWGQGDNDWYSYPGEPIKLRLKANQVCGVAFESSGKRLYPDPQSQEEHYAVIAQLATDDTGRTLEESEFLFPPYYIWNESMFVEQLIE